MNSKADGQNGKPSQNESPDQNSEKEGVEEDPPVRVILLGVLGPPERWQAIYGVVEQVCQPMCFPFSPDEPEHDRRLFANVVEYASTATDLQGDLISGQPTVAFCLPGIDRTRRMGIVAEAIPRSLLHHQIYGGLLYFGVDQNEEMSTGLVEAMARGFDTWMVGDELSDLSERDLAQSLSQWMTRLDPQASGPEDSPSPAASPVEVF